MWSMVRNHKPTTNLFRLDVEMFERYFGVKSQGPKKSLLDLIFVLHIPYHNYDLDFALQDLV